MFGKLTEFFAGQIGRIVGIVALILIGLFILNRFVPFVNTSYSLGTSALSIKEVKEIGELMSAEFYGEIIHSLREGFESNSDEAFKNTFTSLKEKVPFFYQIHKNELFPNKANERLNDKQIARVWNEVYKYFKEYSDDREKLVYLHLLRISNKNRKLKKPKKDEELQFFRALMNENIIWDSFINNGGRDDFFREEKDKFAAEILNQIEIHYLCRGWVKAGYDLTTIANTELKADTSGLLKITGLDPYILSADINPWFIPPQGPYTEGVPGFELLKVAIKDKARRPSVSISGDRAKKEIPFRLISRTKKTARIELIEEALERDIFGTAKSSAEESLLQLIQMLDPENKQGVKAIEIVHSENF
ncbi:MAG: hypothetical protein AAFR87_12610, partial [Bacteroidota bacterium]